MNKYFRKMREDVNDAAYEHAKNTPGMQRYDRLMLYGSGEDASGRPSRSGVRRQAERLEAEKGGKATVTKRAPQKAKKVSRIRNVL